MDFLVPNMKEVAGYSISSTPKRLSDINEIDLAVKFSDFPPTKWVHEEVGTLDCCYSYLHITQILLMNSYNENEKTYL